MLGRECNPDSVTGTNVGIRVRDVGAANDALGVGHGRASNLRCDVTTSFR